MRIESSRILGVSRLGQPYTPRLLGERFLVASGQLLLLRLIPRVTDARSSRATCSTDRSRPELAPVLADS